MSSNFAQHRANVQKHQNVFDAIHQGDFNSLPLDEKRRASDVRFNAVTGKMELVYEDMKGPNGTASGLTVR